MAPLLLKMLLVVLNLDPLVMTTALSREKKMLSHGNEAHPMLLLRGKEETIVMFVILHLLVLLHGLDEMARTEIETEEAIKMATMLHQLLRLGQNNLNHQPLQLAHLPIHLVRMVVIVDMLPVMVAILLNNQQWVPLLVSIFQEPHLELLLD